MLALALVESSIADGRKEFTTRSRSFFSALSTEYPYDDRSEEDSQNRRDAEKSKGNPKDNHTVLLMSAILSIEVAMR